MLRQHAFDLLGVDPDKLASPWIAALSSFICFALGARVPLIPPVDRPDSYPAISADALPRRRRPRR